MKSKNASQKIICLNRKASFNYYFKELYEAGIVLKGSEVKSLRIGKGSIADSYAVDIRGEIFLINSHIPLYKNTAYLVRQKSLLSFQEKVGLNYYQKMLCMEIIQALLWLILMEHLHVQAHAVNI